MSTYYVRCNPHTLEPDTGSDAICEVAEDDGIIIKRLVSGVLDDDTGEFTPAPSPELPTPEPSELDILGQQLVALELRLLAMEGGGGV